VKQQGPVKREKSRVKIPAMHLPEAY